MWFLTKLNCCLLDLALALLDGKGDDVKVHAIAAQLDLLGGTTALLVAADQAVLHIDSVPIQHEGEAAGAGLLPHFHLLASKGILEKYFLDFFAKGLDGPLTARMAGTKKRKPSEISEVLMVEEPQVDLVLPSPKGYLRRWPPGRPGMKGQVTGAT